MKFFTACCLFLYLYGRIDGQLDCGNIEKDLLFIVDESASISDDDFDQILRPFLVDVVGCYNLSADAIQISLTTFSVASIDRFGLDEFNDNVTGAQDFMSNFIRTVDNTATQTYFALQSVRENVIGSPADRPDVGNCLVIITDGGSNAPGNTLNQRELIEPFVDEVFVIGVGSSINETELDALASLPLSSHKFLASNIGDLQNFKDIFAAIPCPPCDPECLNGGFCDRPNQVCECTEDFTGDVCETRSCEAEAENCVFSERDVICVLDYSSTLNGATFSGGQFGKVKDAANAIITGLDQEGDIVRVAALFFASDVKIVFDLDEFKGNLTGATETLAAEIRLRGGTNLADAFKDIQTEILNSPGDRPEVGNTLIIIGDGESNAPLSKLKAYNSLTNEFPDIQVVTVGVGTLIVTELEFLARPPTKFFPVEKAGALDQITDDILDELCKNIYELPCR